MTDQAIHKVGRIDQIVRDYFAEQSAIDKIAAKDLMPLFIQKGVFARDHLRPGKPIRDVLRQLDYENKLSLLHHCSVVRHPTNRNWYFVRKG